jgi:arginase
VELTVFDPDYDPDGAYAAELVAAVVAGLAPLRPAEQPTGGRSAAAAVAADSMTRPAAAAAKPGKLRRDRPAAGAVAPAPRTAADGQPAPRR